MTRPLTDADRASFRDRMCDVAEKKFAHLGPEGVTLRELAAAMGVSSMTPYRYFKDKDQIFAAVRTRAFTRMAEAMEREEEELKDSTEIHPGEAYFDWAIAHPDAYRLMFGIEHPTMSEYPELVAAMHRARQTMTAGWRRLQRAGKFNGNVDDVAHMCWTATHGAVILELSGMLRKPVDARKIVLGTIAAIARGMNLSHAAR